MLSLLLAACAPSDPITTTVVSTSSTATTSTSTAATTSTGTTGSSTTDPLTAYEEPTWTGLRLDPAWLVVEVGALVRPRGVLFDGLGHHADATPVLESSDPAVVRVSEDGAMEAVGAGTVTVTATANGLSGTAILEVRADAVMRVRAVDVHGQPLEGARGILGDEKATADADGWIELPTPHAGPVDLVVYDDAEKALIPATVMGVTAREVLVPLRPIADASEPEGWVEGAVDLSALPPSGGIEDTKGTGLFIVGLAANTIQQGSLFADVATLIAPDRTVDVLGLEVKVPSNVFAEDIAETWGAPAWPGEVGAWGFAGPVPIAEALTELLDHESALTFLLTHLPGFLYQWEGGLQAEAGVVTGQDLRPAVSLTTVVRAHVPELPTGFQGGETPVLFAVHPTGQAGGPAVAGLGRGLGRVDVARAPGSAFGWAGEGDVVALVEDGGLASGGSTVLVRDGVEDGVAWLPAWMAPASIDRFDGATHALQATVDARASVVRLHVMGRDRNHRDIWVTGGADVDVIADFSGPSIGLGVTYWDLTAVDTVSGTFDGLLAEGALTAAGLEQRARGTAFAQADVTGP